MSKQNVTWRAPHHVHYKVQTAKSVLNTITMTKPRFSGKNAPASRPRNYCLVCNLHTLAQTHTHTRPIHVFRLSCAWEPARARSTRSRATSTASDKNPQRAQNERNRYKENIQLASMTRSRSKIEWIEIESGNRLEILGYCIILDNNEIKAHMWPWALGSVCTQSDTYAES